MLIVNRSTGNYSNTTVFSDDVWGPTYRSDLIGWMVSNLVIWIVGVFLDLVILYLIITESPRRSGATILIAHQIILDLVQCALSLPTDIFSTYYLRPFSSIECSLMRVPFMWMECAAHWSTLATAINRFVAIWLPYAYKKVSGKGLVSLFVVFPWFVGMVLCLPYLTRSSGSFMSFAPWYRCQFRGPGAFSMNNFLYFGFILPIGLLTALYTATSLRMSVCMVRNSVNDVLDATVAQRLRKRFALARMLFAASMLYLLFYLPNPVLSWLAPWILNTSPMPRMWLRTCYSLGLFVNPVVFFCMNSSYRRGLERVVQQNGGVITSRIVKLLRIWPSYSQKDTATVGKTAGIAASHSNTELGDKKSNPASHGVGTASISASSSNKSAPGLISVGNNMQSGEVIPLRYASSRKHPRSAASYILDECRAEL